MKSYTKKRKVKLHFADEGDGMGDDSQSTNESGDSQSEEAAGGRLDKLQRTSFIVSNVALNPTRLFGRSQRT